MKQILGRASIALGLFALATVGCDKSKACVRQHLPALMDAASKVPASSEASSHVVKALLKRCPSLPKKIRALLSAYHIPSAPYALGKLQISRSLRQKACPGHTKEALAGLKHMPSLKVEEKLHGLCKGRGSEYISKGELRDSCGPPFSFGAMVYRWLLDTGLAKAQARRFLRNYYHALPVDDHLQGLSLPQVRGLPYVHMSSLSASSKALFTNRMKVCDIAKGQVDPAMKKGKQASSFLILPLLEKLQEAALKRKKIARLVKSFRFEGKLALGLHPKTPFRLITELLHTAGQAGFHRFYFLVGKPKPPHRGCPQMLPIQSPKLWKRELPLLTVYLTHKGSRILLQGRDLPAKCQLKGVDLRSYGGHTSALAPANLAQLDACLGKLKKRLPKKRFAILMAEATLPYSAVLEVLLRLRQSKDGAARFPQIVFSTGSL